jgi:hypothetical protein
MIEIDPQDPLPEPGFLWRRLLTFAVTAALIGLLWALAYLLTPEDLLPFAQGLMLLLALIWLLYAGGASATDLARVIQSAAVLKAGVFGERVDQPVSPTVEAPAAKSLEDPA